MTYRSRMNASIVVASAVHVLAVLVPWDHGYPDASKNPSPASEPVVMRLQPDPPGPTPKRLIDITEPAAEPVDSFTDLIADADANAADVSEIDSAETAPHMEEIDESERLAAPEEPATSPERPPVPQTEPAPESAKPEDAPERMQLAQTISEPDPFDREASTPQPPLVAQEQVVQQSNTPVPQLPKGRTRGRVHGGTVVRGLPNFEAKKHEYAPYLKVVRNRVERHWRQAILLRFSGTTPRKAILDCAIAPDGRIVEVTIVDSGGSGTYAAMCRQAVLDAGPFPPFPFEVPPGYRTRNMEITWTFSYL